MASTKYNTKIVIAYYKECGLPPPTPEFAFHHTRSWRFDFAWPNGFIHNTVWPLRLALEVQGGLFVKGAHARGAFIVKEHEKRNEAAALGWRILYVQPDELCMLDTVNLIKRAMGL